MTKTQITIKNKEYPDILRNIYNPPKKLFYRGQMEVLEKTCIAIIGTRKYSDYGEIMTKKIVRELAVLDIAIVSGLAKGIDTIAHMAAMENNLPTIAVLGSGINHVYPYENTNLSRKIEKNGLIFSEYKGNTAPMPFHFPQRNRIVSGLSIATIVIEAPKRSGALITARLALEQGRDIFVVPGDTDRENSKGTLYLLQSGAAYPIESGQDVMDVLQKQPHLFKSTTTARIPASRAKQNKQSLSKPKYNLNTIQEKIMKALPIRRHKTLEQIQKKTSITTEKLLQNLSLLEIQGLTTTKDGKYLRRC